mmetsp:Transcript_12335/g.20736  ORF Transcript_12335/g.20736 Transcript_12335/m.20736 type:complete len:277 (+) Transcript_12335:439-1269(+)
MPAQKKPPKPVEDREFKEQPREKREGEPRNDLKQGEFKKDKEKTLKLNFDDETNWNYLFMNQDTVATAMAKKMGIQKSEMFDPTASNLAVKLAQSETIIINQTKEWLKDECGIDLHTLDKNPRSACRRSETTLLVKNIPFSTKERELRDIFERYGQLERLLISPFNTLAIVEFKNPTQAKMAAKNLAYYKVNYIMPIYLEFAPVTFDELKEREAEDSEESEQAGGNEEAIKEKSERTVFVKNLNFNSTEVDLENVFKSVSLGCKIKSVKIVRRKDN